MPRQSRLSANDKGDNAATPGTIQRSRGVYLAAEETPARRRSDRPRRLKCGLLPPYKVGTIAQQKEGKTERIAKTDENTSIHN